MNRWINHYTDHEEAKINLFCFHHSGSSSSYFAQWVRFFPETINIFPVQYPMRDNRMSEPLPETLQLMAQNMAEESEELFQKPFAFLGHSSGSLVAFEVAQQVRKKYGRQPERLIVSGSVAPAKSTLKSTKHLSNEMFFKYYKFPQEMMNQNEELLNYLLPMIRADYVMCEKYRYVPQEPLDCPIFAFAGDKDDAVEPVEAIDYWADYTTDKTFQRKVFPGDHLYFERNREEICQIITKLLVGSEKD